METVPKIRRYSHPMLPVSHGSKWGRPQLDDDGGWCQYIDAEHANHYWREKYFAIVAELQKHTIVADGGQYRADVIEAIQGLAKGDKAWRSLGQALREASQCPPK